jgi:hypothetical protein
MSVIWNGAAVAEVQLLAQDDICFITRVDLVNGSMLFVELTTGMFNPADLRVRIGAPRRGWRRFVAELTAELDRHDAKAKDDKKAEEP